MVKKDLRDGAASASCSEHDQCLVKTTTPKSYSYRSLACAVQQWPLLHPARMGTGFLTSKDWENAWESAIKSSKDVRCKVVQYKILCRTYITLIRLSKPEDKYLDKCWRGSLSRGSSWLVLVMNEILHVHFLVLSQSAMTQVQNARIFL